MTAVLALFWNICLLRRGPQFVPTQSLFLIIVISVSVLVHTFLALTYYPGWPALAALSTAVLDLSITAGITWFALFLKNLPQRFPQTITALIGCDLLLSTVLAIFVLFTGNPTDQLTQSIVVLVSIWIVSVSGYILHHALNISVFMGILLFMAISLISTMFTLATGPAPA